MFEHFFDANSPCAGLVSATDPCPCTGLPPLVLFGRGYVFAKDMRTEQVRHSKKIYGHFVLSTASLNVRLTDPAGAPVGETVGSEHIASPMPSATNARLRRYGEDGAEETADPEYRAVTAGGVEDEVAVERAVEDAG